MESDLTKNAAKAAEVIEKLRAIPRSKMITLSSAAFNDRGCCIWREYGVFANSVGEFQIQSASYPLFNDNTEQIDESDFAQLTPKELENIAKYRLVVDEEEKTAPINPPGMTFETVLAKAFTTEAAVMKVALISNLESPISMRLDSTKTIEDIKSGRLSKNYITERPRMLNSWYTMPVEDLKYLFDNRQEKQTHWYFIQFLDEAPHKLSLRTFIQPLGASIVQSDSDFAAVFEAKRLGICPGPKWCPIELEGNPPEDLVNRLLSPEEAETVRKSWHLLEHHS